MGDLSTSKKNIHVVIIGAGTAGLSAAMRLSRKPEIRVTILEATNRIGGRIKSGHQVNAQIVDLGASWMHETRNNASFKLASQHNWPMKYTDVVERKFTDKGEITIHKGIEPIVRDLENCITSKFHDESESVDPETEPSIESFVASELSSMPLITEHQKKLAHLVFKYYEHFMGIPLNKIPASDGGSPNIQGRDAFVSGKGYELVIDWLKTQIDWTQTSVKLESPVLKVEINLETADEEIKTGRQYRVEYVDHDKDSSRQALVADYVVSTIPIGASKHSFDSIFIEDLLKNEPSLRGVRDTVGNTDVAQSGKVIVHFSKRFWDQHTDSFFVAHEKTKECLSMINPYGSNALIVLTGPGSTEKVESDPDNAYKLIQWAFPIIAQPGEPVSDVRSIQVSDWTQSPYFLGSYSARGIGQSFDGLVNGYLYNESKVRFAGEHTILEGNGCVHGAYESGLREAAIILNKISTKEQP